MRTARSIAAQDAGAGVFLIALAALALWQGADLAAGTLRQMGPGMLPRALAVATGAVGVAVLIGAFLKPGEGMGRWSVRGILFVLGAAVAFSLTIRPLGLAVAAPIALMLAAQASPETRLVESLIFAVALTLFCVGLFKFALGLPIPVLPWLVGY